MGYNDDIMSLVGVDLESGFLLDMGDQTFFYHLGEDGQVMVTEEGRTGPGMGVDLGTHPASEYYNRLLKEALEAREKLAQRC